MAPKRKSQKMTNRSGTKSVPKTEKIASKNASPIKKRSERRPVPKTPENKKNVEPIPSTSKEVNPSCSYPVENKKPSPIKRRYQRRLVPKTPENKKNVEPIPSTSKEVNPSCSYTVENKTSPIKRRYQRRPVPKTPKNKKNEESTPSTSEEDSPSCSYTVKNKKSGKEDVTITPKIMKYCLNAYKQSPDYADLKNKRFNTSFLYETPRRCPDIQIFPEEVPAQPSRVPGDMYADIFLGIPGLSDSDLDQIGAETKSKRKGKKGRKKSVGYKGVPLPDECLDTDYSRLFDSS